MANANFSLGQVNITDYLLLVMREVGNPSVAVDSQVFTPPHPSSINVAFADLNPVTHYCDFRKSPDGVALGDLLGTFTIDVKNNIVLTERRFYLVDGQNEVDPVSGQDTLVDPYLDGKEISGIFQEGFRFLVPPGNTNAEYTILTGGGFQLLQGYQFDPSQIWSVDISYVANQVLGSGSGLYSDVVDIASDTDLSSFHYGKRINCASSSSRLVINLPAIGSTPELTKFYFTSNGGNQYQTRIKTQTGEIIQFGGDAVSELSISPGEFVVLEKRGVTWEVVQSHHGLNMVGERISAQWSGHSNTLPEDGTLYDGDDYPRIWWFIKNKLPMTHYITDDSVTTSGYTHPESKVGLFVIHSTLKKFRMPNTQNMSERGLKSFSSFNTDADRQYDYPGGFQDEMLLTHTHAIIAESTDQMGLGALTGGSDDNVNDGTAFTGTPLINGAVSDKVGDENRIKNIGVIYLRRI